MAISLNSIKRGVRLKPTIDLIYAPQGMGKTTFAAGAPNPIFIQTEDGLGLLDSATFGLLKSYGEVISALQVLATTTHDFRTVIVDSAGWLEPLIWAETCRRMGWVDIEAPGYGKGPVAAAAEWRVVLEGLSYLRDECNMGVIILAHSQVKTQHPPDGEDYDRYQPKLHERATAMLQEYADDVFLINTRVSVTRSNQADKNSRSIAVGSNQRFLYTSLKPTHMAKNRWGMPEMIPLPNPPPKQSADPFALFAAVAVHIPYYKAMIDGNPNPSGATTQDAGDIPAAAVAGPMEVVSPFSSLGVKEEVETATDEAAE